MSARPPKYGEEESVVVSKEEKEEDRKEVENAKMDVELRRLLKQGLAETTMDRIAALQAGPRERKVPGKRTNDGARKKDGRKGKKQGKQGKKGKKRKPL